MDDSQLTRYSRHIVLPEIDEIGQTKLLNSRVFIVGLGGLGGPVSLYLANCGVGCLVINDYDQVDLSNLQRQILFTSQDVNVNKAQAAARALRRFNSDTEIIEIERRLSEIELHEQIKSVDAVIDASDNFPTRIILNKVCIAERKPLISGSAIQMNGQVTVFRLDLNDAPCYNCLYPDQLEHHETCAEVGVLSPLTGIIGCIQALETIKLLIGFGASLNGRLLQIDAKTMRCRETSLKKDPECPSCTLTMATMR